MIKILPIKGGVYMIEGDRYTVDGDWFHIYLDDLRVASIRADRVTAIIMEEVYHVD